MNKTALAAIAMTLLLAACEGHQYEPVEPGVTVSGEAGIGVTYKDGRVEPDSDTTVTVSVGGSI